ncbi:hypothetical protein [Actinoplanes sp. NPDC020271]|uniref:hypothetical protein n=1 Tax=Actinoplanes sp. NPDC020271 TaxID=3363896 RepID=UPI00378907DE
MFETGRLRRRHPRLSGTLRVRDTLGHDITIPLRGRAAVLTTGGTGLTGHGEVWAVHTDTDATTTSLMISYGRTAAARDRESGLCPAGATVTLGGASFTWHCPVADQPASATDPAASATDPAASDAGPAASDAGPAASGADHSASAAAVIPHPRDPGLSAGSSSDPGGEPHPGHGGTGPVTTRFTSNNAPSASRDPAPARNTRPPRPRSATSNLRQRVKDLVRDLTHPSRH